MKLFDGINVLALPLAAIVSFVFGGIWYGLLSKRWMEAANLDPSRLKPGGGTNPVPFVITFLAELVMAWVLAGILLHLRKSGAPASAYTGMLSAAMIWAGFVVTTLAVNHQFQMQRASLTVIDGGHWLGVLLLQGAILGYMGLV